MGETKDKALQSSVAGQRWRLCQKSLAKLFKLFGTNYCY